MEVLHKNVRSSSMISATIFIFKEGGLLFEEREERFEFGLFDILPPKSSIFFLLFLKKDLNILFYYEISLHIPDMQWFLGSKVHDDVNISVVISDTFAYKMLCQMNKW